MTADQSYGVNSRNLLFEDVVVFIVVELLIITAYINERIHLAG